MTNIKKYSEYSEYKNYIFYDQPNKCYLNEINKKILLNNDINLQDEYYLKYSDIKIC